MLFKHKNIFSGKVSGERSVKLIFNNAHGESGMLIVLKNGDRFALRGSKKITPQLVDFFRNHNITVEQ